MGKIVQIDYTRIPFNAWPAEELPQPGEDRQFPTGYLFAVWFDGRDGTRGYGASLIDAVVDLFRKTDKS